MSAVAPNLLYLAIYNPTLRPSIPADPDDEDAEEYAHILFYTAREQAVSRDRMLRQVGLAKALINFSQMFNLEQACDNVHSQGKRMVMVSPEPDFWIHAGIELAKTPRITKVKTKLKGNGKDGERGKGKEKEKEQQVLYDYVDSSIHDIPLRVSLLRGYEQFKLTHGSFTSILLAHGQHALEMQLERFFTVWAWTWNIENGHDFESHLGLPLHPLYQSLAPIIDRLSSPIFQIHAVVISPPFIIPSNKFKASRYPPSLCQHLLALSRRRDAVTSEATDLALNSPPEKSSRLHGAGQQPLEVSTSRTTVLRRDSLTQLITQGVNSKGTFLRMPSMHLNVDLNMDMMDVRRWSWHGFRRLGKKGTPAPQDAQKVKHRSPYDAANGQGNASEGGTMHHVDVSRDVDTSSLAEAIDSEDIRDSNSQTPIEEELPPAECEVGGGLPHTLTSLNAPTNSKPLDQGSEVPTTDALSSDVTSPENEMPTPVPSAMVDFSCTTVHLAGDEPLVTCSKQVFYIMKHDLTLALLGLDDREDDIQSLSQNAFEVLEDLRNAIDREGKKDVSDTLLLSAAKILQPQDKSVIVTSHFTVSKPGLDSESEHLFNAQAIQQRDADISEVFSRGQNPQHWHVAKKRFCIDDDGKPLDGEIYMEVSRKEASLSDVDNALTGVARRYTRQ